MPFFSKTKLPFWKEKKGWATNETEPFSLPSDTPTTKTIKSTNEISSTTSNQPKPAGKSKDSKKLVFSCQLAHGSSNGQVSDFTSTKGLYQKISECFNIPESHILFCTLNTHRIDMTKLLGGHIGLNDLIFAHIRGQPKEIDLLKSEETIGLTITDNGAGYTFIKKIKENSISERLGNVLKVGDHIEKINNRSVIGIRHFDVAKMLKDLPLGSSFRLRLIEPIVYDFPFDAPRRNIKKSDDLKTGTKTLRFKPDGRVSIEEIDDQMAKAIESINVLLDTYMGINDAQLSQQIWELAETKSNPSDFATAIDESDLGSFNFSDEFIFDLWAAIRDVKDGRDAKRPVLGERL